MQAQIHTSETRTVDYPPGDGGITRNSSNKKRKREEGCQGSALVTMEEIKQTFEGLDAMLSRLSSPPIDGILNQERLEQQKYVLEKIRQFRRKVSLLEKARDQQSEVNVKERHSIVIDQYNLKTRYQEFLQLCSVPESSLDRYKIELYFTGFCDYAWHFPLERSMQWEIEERASVILGDNFRYWFGIYNMQGSMDLFPISKLAVASTHSYQLHDAVEVREEGTKTKPFAIFEVDFLHLCKFMASPDDYILPDQGEKEKTKALLLSLMMRSQFYAYADAQTFFERSFKPFVTLDNAKEIYELASKYRLPLLQKYAIECFPGVSLSSQGGAITITDRFFERCDDLPSINTCTLLDVSCSLSSERIKQLVKIFPEIGDISLLICGSICHIEPSDLKGFKRLQCVSFSWRVNNREVRSEEEALGILQSDALKKIIAPYKVSFKYIESSESVCNPSAQALLHIATMFSSIEALLLPPESAILADVGVWQEILSQLPHIRCLSIPIGVIKSDLNLPKLCPNLQILVLIGYDFTLDNIRTVVQITKECEHLKSLFFECVPVNDREFWVDFVNATLNLPDGIAIVMPKQGTPWKAMITEIIDSMPNSAARMKIKNVLPNLKKVDLMKQSNDMDTKWYSDSFFKKMARPRKYKDTDQILVNEIASLMPPRRNL